MPFEELKSRIRVPAGEMSSCSNKRRSQDRRDRGKFFRVEDELSSELKHRDSGPNCALILVQRCVILLSCVFSQAPREKGRPRPAAGRFCFASATPLRPLGFGSP